MTEPNENDDIEDVNDIAETATESAKESNELNLDDDLELDDEDLALIFALGLC